MLFSPFILTEINHGLFLSEDHFFLFSKIVILLLLVQCLTFTLLIHDRELFECPPVLSVPGNGSTEGKHHYTETQVHIWNDSHTVLRYT